MQEINIVGGTTTAPGLGNNQSCFIEVVLAAFQGMQKLPYDQKSGVTNVIVHIFKPCFHYFTAGVLQNLHLVAAAGEGGLHQGKMDGQHAGHQNSVGMAHFLCKGYEISLGVCLGSFLHSKNSFSDYLNRTNWPQRKGYECESSLRPDCRYHQS